MTLSPLRRERGSTLIEALVALVILALGLLGHAGLHATLRRHADLARQQGDATRITQDLAEAARAFVDVPAPDAPRRWGELVDAGGPADAPPGPTAFEWSRRVEDDATGAWKTMTLQVQWQDRQGQDRQTRLHTLIGGVPPTLSGALLVGGRTAWVGAPRARHPAIPWSAVDGGDGHSVWRASPTQAWVFDNATARVTGLCEGLDPAQRLAPDLLASCVRPVDAQMISGHVRFAGGSGVNLDLALTLTSTGHSGPGAQCVDDAPVVMAAAVTRHYAAYHCIVHANASHRWSGRTDIVPRAFVDTAAPAWSLAASGPSALRVCRYSPASDSVSNAGHPAQYLDVTGPLVHQNFLILPADAGCPADQDASDLVDSTTAPHQP